MNLLLRVICLCVALAPAMVNAQQSWSRVGSSDMRWMIFKLYNITLLTVDGQYSPDTFPQALEIRYYRDIDKKDLVKVTGEQWENQGISTEQRNQWLPELLALWPDINDNDVLRFEVDSQGGNQFLYNGKVIGSVEAQGFSQAFLNIWLSQKTSQPELRKRLISGQSENV